MIYLISSIAVLEGFMIWGLARLLALHEKKNLENEIAVHAKNHIDSYNINAIKVTQLLQNRMEN